METDFKKSKSESEQTTSDYAKTSGTIKEPNETQYSDASGPNVVTIPVPVVQAEGNYAYVTIKGSLHDTSCAVFGLNAIEVQALSKRYRGGVKPVINGVMVSLPPVDMINVLAQLSYRVVTSCGEAEICWTLQREV